MSTPAYPVRVDAALDPQLSRWLWLVKWLLAIPHYLVLALLWLAFVVLSAVALVAILVTGRYPRAIFDFNVGVLRWSWRVTYYAYGGLGTDHYPPFSLEERPDFPAHLEIAYPEHLSRGLVLVKWWLLAIPHYLLLALFLGSGVYVAQLDDSATRGWSGGLIGLLVFFAAVALLFTGRYPRPIFDLVLGLNRWVLRVAAYAALMTDRYPPFRLDLGGQDPGTGVLTLGAPPTSPATSPTTSPTTDAPTPGGSGAAPDDPATSGTPAVAPSPRDTRRRWSAGRIVAVVVGSVLALTSCGLLAGGLALRIADGGLRDGRGYLMSPESVLSSPGYAISSSSVKLHTGSTQLDVPRRWLGTVAVDVDARSSGAVFVGLARTADVRSYLSGVAHSVTRDRLDPSGDPVTRLVPGGPPRLEPRRAGFWEVSAVGPGQQTLTWDPRPGNWSLVVMNPDGARNVAADVSVGAELPVLDDVAIGLLVAGLGLLVVSVGVLVAALRRVPTAA